MKLKKCLSLKKCSGRARRGVECVRRPQGQDTSCHERLPDDGMNGAVEAPIVGSKRVRGTRVDLEQRVLNCQCRCKCKGKWKDTYNCECKCKCTSVYFVSVISVIRVSSVISVMGDKVRVKVCAKVHAKVCAMVRAKCVCVCV